MDAGLMPKKLLRSRPLFDRDILRRATLESFRKLNPVTLWRNPVIFVVELCAALTTVYVAQGLRGGLIEVNAMKKNEPPGEKGSRMAWVKHILYRRC